MLRFAKWAVVPAVVCLAATFGNASDAQAAGWGISVNSGYPAYSCGPSYGAYGYSAYGYSPYGYYGPAPIRVYRPAYYPPSFYFSFGGRNGGHHGHHDDHHGHHDDHHGGHH